LRVVPQSACTTTGVRDALVSAQIRVLEWTELDVPTSAQSKSIYIRGGDTGAGWTTYPTGGPTGELFVEAEYLNHETALTTAVSTSTAVLTDDTTWVQFSIPSFTPAQVGPVRYRVIFGAYESGGCEIFVDNQLVTA
jgi:hypothetical protein